MNRIITNRNRRLLNRVITGNMRVFVVALALSLPFWWTANAISSTLESAYVDRMVATEMDNSNLEPLQSSLIASMPLQSGVYDVPEVYATSAISVWVRSDGSRRVLMEKNPGLQVPIASITKLMTAYVASGHYDENEILQVSFDADYSEFRGRGFSARFHAGQEFKVYDLMRAMLIESSNGAARTLADGMGYELFVSEMNREADEIDLDDTVFFNPSGLDPQSGSGVNQSSAEDLVSLTIKLHEQYPEIFDLLGTPQYTVRDTAGRELYTITSTNELLFREGLSERVLAGKTGTTFMAGNSLLLVTRSPIDDGFIVHVILGAQDRFNEMMKLINLAEDGHKWSVPSLNSL